MPNISQIFTYRWSHNQCRRDLRGEVSLSSPHTNFHGTATSISAKIHVQAQETYWLGRITLGIDPSLGPSVISSCQTHRNNGVEWTGVVSAHILKFILQ